ncbi:MAG: Panacea domain-containing protein [Pseudomonadota bacterium]
MVLDRDFQFNKEKFRDVVHWICERFEDTPDKLGRTKLHKLLYFSDMFHYLDTGSPLTGVDYLKQPYGPTARHLGATLVDLVDSGTVDIVRRNYFGYNKYDFHVKSFLRSNLISEKEKFLLSEVCDFAGEKSAKEISDISHKDPWDSVAMGEVIPYDTAPLLLPRRAPTEQDVSWANNAVSKIIQGETHGPWAN